MLDHELGEVPVVDTNGRLLGMLTEGDLIARRIPRRARRWWEVVLRRCDYTDPPSYVTAARAATFSPRSAAQPGAARRTKPE